MLSRVSFFCCEYLLVEFIKISFVNYLKGYLKIENWKPIRLDSISSIVQCPLSSAFNSSSSLNFTSSTPSLQNLKTTTMDTDSFTNTDKKNLIDKNDFFPNEAAKSRNSDYKNVNNEVVSMRSSSRQSSLTSSSCSISASQSSSDLSRSSSPKSRTSRRARSCSVSSKNSEYSDYANDYDTEEDTSDACNLKEATELADNMTVNDMLSHVISFATLSIKLTVKSPPEQKMPQSHQPNKISDDLIKQDNQQVQQQQQQVQHIQPQHLIQTFLQTIQSKQNMEQQSSSLTPTPSAGSSQQLGMPGLPSKYSEELFKKVNDIILPMLLFSSSTNSTLNK